MCFMETFVAPIIETNSKSLGPAIWLFSTLSNSDPEYSSTHSSTKSIKSEKKRIHIIQINTFIKMILNSGWVRTQYPQKLHTARR